MHTLVVLIFALAASDPGVLWIEGEAWYAQQGSYGPDRPPPASRGECLGSGWGTRQGDFATYRFFLERSLEDLTLWIRYARLDLGASRFDVLCDGKPLARGLEFPPTGGWGHQCDAQWQWKSIPLESLEKGWHELKLLSLSDKNNTNIDGLLLDDSGQTPPAERKTLEAYRQPALRRGPEAPGPDCIDEALSLADFSGRLEDWYYPAEEPAERAGLAIPRLEAVTPREAVFAKDGTEAVRTTLGGALDGWRVVETLAEPTPMAVLEREFDRWGLILYLGRNGPVAEVRKAVGRLDKIRQPHARFPKDYFEQVIAAQEDVLGKKVLACGREPAYQDVAGFLAPLETYTFLGSPDSLTKYIVHPDGAIGPVVPRQAGGPATREVIFDPATAIPAIDPAAAKRGLLGGYLPAIDYGYFEPQRGSGFELCAFMEPGPSATTFMRVRLSDAKTSYFRLEPLEPLPDGKAFYAALLKLHRYWSESLASGMKLELPDRRVMDVARGTLARALSGCPGKHPKYGMGAYWGTTDRHDGFPPTTLSLCTCLLDWGLAEEAKARLGYYLDHFVKDDGTLVYYGPAVAEYGQLVDLAAGVVRRTEDEAWFHAHRLPIERIVGYLMRLRTAARQKQPPQAVTYGLICGSAEADTHTDVQYYFSGNAWCWRGLRELGGLLVDLGRKRRDDVLLRRGEELLAESDSLRVDILRAVDRSIIRSGQQPFLPPIAGYGKPFDRMTESTLASYTNYRYWLETLSARCLEPKQEQMILDYRLRHGGELLGMTRFSGHLDDWPYYHHAAGVLGHDRVDRYLLGYFAHIAHHQTPGTFTAYEQVPIRGWRLRRQTADYCVPSQLTAALMTRWMLVFEDRDEELLWLCRAAPRAWFAQEFAANGALTRWGRVSVRLRPSADLRTITARVTVEKTPAPAVMLRVRHPQRMRIAHCEANGARCKQIDAEREVVRLQPDSPTLQVTLRFEPGVAKP